MLDILLFMPMSVKVLLTVNKSSVVPLSGVR